MTDIDQMEAGRELDALIAEKVMGWEIFECGYFGTEDETERMRELRDWMDKVELDSVGLYAIDVEKDFFVSLDGYDPWSPSTSIAAAWGVVEKVSSEEGLKALGLSYCYGFAVEHRAGLDGSPDDYKAGFREYDYDDGDAWMYSATAPTAPLAICRAALKAVMR